MYVYRVLYIMNTLCSTLHFYNNLHKNITVLFHIMFTAYVICSQNIKSIFDLPEISRTALVHSAGDGERV